MMAKQSHYSIIQFRPDEARAEGVNVGVVVACPSKQAVRVRFSLNNEAPKRRFGKNSFDDGRLTSAKRALANRLEQIEPGEASLRSFLAQEAGSLVLLEPRPIVINDLDVDLADLFEELVGEIAPEHRARRPKTPDLAKSFESLFSAGIAIDRDVPVSIPGLPTELRYPYAFKNGVRNFIKPQGFALGSEDAIKEAKELGADGYLLAKHPDGGLQRRLIVVGAFEDAAIVPGLKKLMDDFDTRLLTVSEIPQLVEEIRVKAHR